MSVILIQKNYFHCFVETDHCLLSHHQKLPPAANGSKHRDPQPDSNTWPYIRCLHQIPPIGAQGT